MSHFPRTLLAASIYAALFVPAAYAESSENTSTQNVSAESTNESDALVTEDTSVQEMSSPDQCLTPNQSDNNSTQEPINIEADDLEGISGDKATYRGEVVVTQGNKRITADTVTYHQQDSVVVAEGNVTYADGQVKTHSVKAVTNLNTDETSLEETKYQFLCEAGRGEAAFIHKSGQAFYEMEDGSLTSCPEGNNAWRLRATTIELNQNDEMATLYNPWVEIARVPVFYLPYLTVPVGDTRKTGFLYPSISMDSTDGFGMEVPIYWNIAPNYDLKTTIKHMEKRGQQLDSYFRYLNDFGQGDITFEYLPEDKKNLDEGKRWGGNWKHNAIIDESWKLEVDYSRVSDISYFSDLSSSIGNREDGQLLQEGTVSYRSKAWDTTLKVKDFQVLSTGSTPYRLMPQLEYNYYAPEFYSKLDFNLLSHISRFETDSTTDPSATRLHIEPTLTLPLAAPWGSFTTEAKMMYSYYQQDLDSTILAEDGNEDLEENVDRAVPKLRLHGELYLERDTVFLDNYVQTLEPQVQYLYIAKKDQSNIYSYYDTTKLQLDYYGLFMDKRYSSVDYIAPANQFSYGATSRFYDDEFRERMNISFGQIIYANSTYDDALSDEDDDSTYSAWAVEADFNFADTVFYHGGLQYDVSTNDFQLANSTLEYRYGGGFSQLNYRYVSMDYIESNAPDYADSDYTNDGISQLGFISQYQLTRKLNAYGQYFYDLTEDVNLEWLARLTYRSDCWYIALTYANQLDSWADDIIGSEATYEKNFSLNFGITGFGTTIGAGSGMAGYDTSSNSLGYGRPFYLNN
ncbi:LPS assembly protein LptD [Vibrio sp. JC009]|uniref:LPS assembly protein LptD n=1 Tax=Vibrio sp. JC009 TaxID=2912314 RepID=UPI0023B1438C|nr:LPS assembly protein LptD [Vibrio sp. JC009]WED22152.1 LPS assembly protein LptD [Vibrio sp. JC009]